jgi:threonylcarbamoyladenosine tRNA methylthiotransferase MtaB
MHRKYRPRHYADRIWKAREWMPDCAVGADVMTGFPGETEDEFEQSRAFIESLPFTYLHVFTYSERPGTPAAVSASQVPVAIRKLRTRVLRELAARKNAEFRRAMIGKTISAVTLYNVNPLAGGALSGNYLKIKLAAAREPNRIVDVRIGGLTADGLAESGALIVM